MTVIDSDLQALMHSVMEEVGSAKAPSTEISLDTTRWLRLAELGLVDLTAAEAEGGSGASWREAAALHKTAAFHAVALPLAEHDLLAGWLLDRSEHERPHSGIMSVGVRGPAGVARRVPWARDADHLVVLQSTGEGWRVGCVSAAEVEIRADTNLAGEPRDDIRVDLSAHGGGRALSDQDAVLFGLRRALTRSTQACGAMERILNLCVEHVRTRQQFGRPLEKFQLIQQMVADIATESLLSSMAVDVAVSMMAADGEHMSPELGFAVTAATSCVGHAASTVVPAAHQIHGAIGTTGEHPLRRLTQPVLSWRSEFGSVRESDELIGGSVLDRRDRDVWTAVRDGQVDVNQLPFHPDVLRG